MKRYVFTFNDLSTFECQGSFYDDIADFIIVSDDKGSTKAMVSKRELKILDIFRS